MVVNDYALGPYEILCLCIETDFGCCGGVAEVLFIGVSNGVSRLGMTETSILGTAQHSDQSTKYECVDELQLTDSAARVWTRRYIFVY